MKEVWIILAFIFLLQPVMPVVDYIVNYDYISTVLCVNKEEPSKKCDGKCQLGKEMAKEVDDTHPKDTSNKKMEISPQLFFEDLLRIDHHLFTMDISKLEFQYLNNLTHEPHVHKLIHPPIA